MLNKTITDFWGEKLYKFSREDIKKFRFNSNTEEYLVNCGIPLVGFGKYYKFKDTFAYIENLRYQKVNGKEFVVFAEDFLEFQQLGIDLIDSNVYLIFPKLNHYYYFNKDIQTYFYCLASMISCIKKYPLIECDYESEEADKQSFQFAQELYGIINSVDSKAVCCGSRWVIPLFEYAEAELHNHFDDYLLLWNSGKYKHEKEPILDFISGKEIFSDKKDS